MFDEDVVFQRREATHDALLACDLCGMPTPAIALEAIARPGVDQAPSELVRACPTCRQNIVGGELPLDVELDLDDE